MAYNQEHLINLYGLKVAAAKFKDVQTELQADYQYLAEAIMSNSATISEYNEYYRTQLADHESRIKKLEGGS